MNPNPGRGLPEVCPLCQGPTTFAFRHKVLRAHQADIHHCPSCDYLFAVRPFWLEEAYHRVINVLDTGCLARAEATRAQTALPIYLLSGKEGQWLDYGAGHGVYVRRMRDIGFDFYWDDPKAENLFAGGFEDRVGKKYDGITCFECLEHFTDPKSEIKKITLRGCRVIFSTELRPERIPSPDQWWYYAWEHGQHVGFHSQRSLSVLAKTFGLQLVSSGRSLHAFLPAAEVDKPAARLIRDSSLPLSAWADPVLRELFSWKVFFRSLMRRRIFSHDFLGSLEETLVSKTWPDHLLLKSGNLYRS